MIRRPGALPAPPEHRAAGSADVDLPQADYKARDSAGAKRVTGVHSAAWEE